MRIALADDGLPIFTVKAELGPIRYPKRSDGTRSPNGCYLVFRCPKCGQENNHGGVFNELGAGDGHRVSHCECWPRGYYIKEVLP